MSVIRRIIARGVKAALRKAGYQIVRYEKPSSGYIDAKETVAAARAWGLSVGDYVETIWNQKGYTNNVIEKMRAAGCLQSCPVVVEIGPGTGRYLERVLQAAKPQRYEIYEIAADWAEWLAATYAPTVVRQPADGRSLGHTPSNSCGLVHAHGVFVCVPFLHCFEYFQEMIRVCDRNGYIAFDFYPESNFDLAAIRTWLATPHRYPVVLPRKQVIDFFVSQDCELVAEFDHPHSYSNSLYLVFRKGCST